MTALRRGYPQNISTSTSSPAARSTERNDMESWTMKSTCLSVSWISWEQRTSQELWRYHFNCKTTDSAWFNSHRLPAFMALIRPAAACLPISKVGTRLSWPYWLLKTMDSPYIKASHHFSGPINFPLECETSHPVCPLRGSRPPEKTSSQKILTCKTGISGFSEA